MLVTEKLKLACTVESNFKGKFENDKIVLHRTNTFYDSKFDLFEFAPSTMLVVKDDSISPKGVAKKYIGTGSKTYEIDLEDRQTTIELLYEFYTEPDELLLYDQNGKELFRSGMMKTQKAVSKMINVSGVTKMILKIDTKDANSRWTILVNAK